jgi:hypothetical protein
MFQVMMIKNNNQLLHFMNAEMKTSRKTHFIDLLFPHLQHTHKSGCFNI